MIDWQRMWNEDHAIRRFSPLRAILYLLSMLYRLAIILRNRLYDRQILKSIKLGCPVISIGNLTVGGTGKTPCVVTLARILQEHGYSPAVISRGYGGRNPGPVNIVSSKTGILLNAAVAGDEPLLIARSLPGVPVLTGPKRTLTGQTAIDRFHCDVLICDDAFQHRRINRDVDIVLLDAARPLGNGHLLPAGELREPLTGLRRASCLMMTRADETAPLHPEIAQIIHKSGIPVFRSIHRFTEMASPLQNISLAAADLRGKKVCAFCGIAKPESFRKILTDAGAKILSFVDFPDHYDYNHHDLEALENHFRTFSADHWVTTEKDAMRLTAWPDFLKTTFIIRVNMEVLPSDPTFEEFILGRLIAE